jgi:hypothetical protein
MVGDEPVAVIRLVRCQQLRQAGLTPSASEDLQVDVSLNLGGEVHVTPDG